MSLVIAYTDGGCWPNPGPGGWGVVLQYGTHRAELHGGEHQTTNNRMELTAAAMALEALTRPVEVEIYTDSQYVANGIRFWIANWIPRGWKTADGKPVKNEDLWQRLAIATYHSGHTVHWRWIKGHSGDPGNERADALATLGREELGHVAV